MHNLKRLVCSLQIAKVLFRVYCSKTQQGKINDKTKIRKGRSCLAPRKTLTLNSDTLHRHSHTQAQTNTLTHVRTHAYGCSIMEKIVITIILVNIEITIIPTIMFEFENMMYFFSTSLPKNTF